MHNFIALTYPFFFRLFNHAPVAFVHRGTKHNYLTTCNKRPAAPVVVVVVLHRKTYRSMKARNHTRKIGGK